MENQYFYIYFAVGIICPQVFQSKTVEAPTVRSFSGYVVSPPLSLHASSNEYNWN